MATSVWFPWVLVVVLLVVCLYLWLEVKRLRDEVYIDVLTKVSNRRAFRKAIANEMARVRRGMGKPLSIAFLDIDRFKSVNDEYGHSTGDAILACLGGILQKKTRSTDFVGRYGGEEFVFILPATTPEGALRHIEEIRSTVERDLWVHYETNGHLVRVARTASFGLVTWDEKETQEVLIARADEALYAAKNGGRNMVVQT